MDKDQAKYHINQIPIERIVDALGIVLNGKMRGECPAAHGSHYPNHFAVYPLKNYFRCWSCGAKGHNIDLWMFATGESYRLSLSNMAKRFLSQRVDFEQPKEHILIDIENLKLQHEIASTIWQTKDDFLIDYKIYRQKRLKSGDLSEADYYTRLHYYDHYRDEAFKEIDREFMNEHNRITAAINRRWEKLNGCA